MPKAPEPSLVHRNLLSPDPALFEESVTRILDALAVDTQVLAEWRDATTGLSAAETLRALGNVYVGDAYHQRSARLPIAKRLARVEKQALELRQALTGSEFMDVYFTQLLNSRFPDRGAQSPQAFVAKIAWQVETCARMAMVAQGLDVPAQRKRKRGGFPDNAEKDFVGRLLPFYQSLTGRVPKAAVHDGDPYGEFLNFALRVFTAIGPFPWCKVPSMRFIQDAVTELRKEK